MLLLNRQVVIVSLLIGSMLSLVTKGTAAEQVHERLWNGSAIVAYLRLAPLSQLKNDLGFLAEAVNEELTKARIDEFFREVTQGLDETRPAGLALYMVDQRFTPMIFLPLKNEEELLTVFRARFGLEFYRGEDGLYRASNGNVFARAHESWFYITGPSNRNQLENLPSNPASVFTKSDLTTLADIAVYPNATSTEFREVFIDGFFSSVSQTSGLTVPESVEPKEILRGFFEQTQLLQLELQCFRPLDQFHITARIEAARVSELGDWIESTAGATSSFAHLISNSTMLALVTSLALGSETNQIVYRAWESIADQARKASPSPNATDAGTRSLGRLAFSSIDAAGKTIRSGELNGGMTIESNSDNEIVVLAGGVLQGGREVDNALSELAGLLQNSSVVPGLQWSVGGNSEVSLHNFEFPVEDESVQKVFGTPMSVALGFGAESLYAAVGNNYAVNVLTNAVERSRRQERIKGELLHAFVRMSPFLDLLDSLPGDNPATDQQIHLFSERIAPFGRNDRLDLTVRASGRALESRLRVDKGIVRMLSAEITESQLKKILQLPATEALQPMAASPESIGPLRMRAGESFEIEFRTEAEITTTVDDNDLLETSRHVQLFAFRVLDVDDEGMMKLETTLQHVRIDKKDWNGEQTFDSAIPVPEDERTAETILNSLAVNHPFVVTIGPDGAIVEISRLEEAIDEIIDTELKPPSSEREQARSFVKNIFNANQFRDALSRGFEFYPVAPIQVGERWQRTLENRSNVRFFLDNRYRLRSINANEAVVSVMSQIRDNNDVPDEDQTVQLDVVGSQTGEIRLDVKTGRLKKAEYTLRTNTDATLEVDGKKVVRPVVGVFKMQISLPAAHGGQTNSASESYVQGDWIDLTSSENIPKWQLQPRQQWTISKEEIASRPGAVNSFQYCSWLEETFQDFELSAEVNYVAGTNGGVCIRAEEGGLDGKNPSGYEVQIHGLPTQRNPTGSIFRIPQGGPVSAVYESRPGQTKPNQWFQLNVIAKDTRITVAVDGITVAEYNDLVAPIRAGHVMLQGSSNGSIRYRNVRLRKLP